MLKILNRKYPAPSAGVRSLITSILFGLFIALFLMFFEPFDINLTSYENKTWVLLFFGLITTIVLLVFLHIMPLLFVKVFSDKHWKVWHQIIFYLTILLVIATFNGIYTNYINSLRFSWSNYWWIICRTFVLGGIPISFLVLLDYKRKINYNISQAQDVLKYKKEFNQISHATIWKISTDLKNEIISFDENDFYHAIAVGNYTDVFTLDNGKIKKTTFRITLSSFEKQIHSSYLKRCHRSYLVNLKKVEHISGNAQGLKLRLSNGQDIVPVSRKYIPSIRQSLLQSS